MKKVLLIIVLLTAVRVWSCENCEVPPWLVVKPAEEAESDTATS